jgi:hypothetical protein
VEALAASAAIAAIRFELRLGVPNMWPRGET